MRQGMLGVLAILRNQPMQRPMAAAGWDVVLECAQEQHVLPIVAARLNETRPELPDATLQKVIDAQREATFATFFFTSELRGILRDFAAAGIDVTPLKGPSLAERIYGATTLRVSRDLDLLVRKSDYAAAEALLVTLGFTPAPRPDDYHRQWLRGTAAVELHWDLENPLAINFHIERAWQNSIAGTFSEQPCHLLAPEDELLYLCIHGVRHRFERMSLVLDIALAFERFPNPKVMLRPEVASLARLVLLGRAMAIHLIPTTAACVEIEAAPQAEQQMQQLADQLWRELTEHPPTPLDWQSQHAFFVQTELTPLSRLRRRMAHLRIAATRLIEPDFTFAARFGMHQPWQAWLLRPARLLFARTRPRTPAS